MRLRQVYKAHRRAVLQAIARRLPFGRAFGEGIKYCFLRIIRSVNQQCYRRRHRFLREQRQHAFRIRRPFDQDGIGLERFHRIAQTACRTGAVMTNAEDVNNYLCELSSS